MCKLTVLRNPGGQVAPAPTFFAMNGLCKLGRACSQGEVRGTVDTSTDTFLATIRHIIARHVVNTPTIKIIFPKFIVEEIGL